MAHLTEFQLYQGFHFIDGATRNILIEKYVFSSTRRG